MIYLEKKFYLLFHDIYYQLFFNILKVNKVKILATLSSLQFKFKLMFHVFLLSNLVNKDELIRLKIDYNVSELQFDLYKNDYRIKKE